MIRAVVSKMSCERDRKKAYAVDLRHRIIWQRYGMSLLAREISTNLCISVGTVYNICRLYTKTGAVDSFKPNRTATRVLSPSDELVLIGLILAHPTLYLIEMRTKLFNIIRKTVSSSTICRILHRHGITRKKVQQIALQRSYILRGDFMAEMSLFSVHQLVWIDETGCDKRNFVRKMGYALRGERPVSTIIMNRGKRISAIAAMCSDGVIALELGEGTNNGEKFYEFVRGQLIPEMSQFDGCASKSVVIMDNSSIHHVREVHEILNAAGILCIFLPPYSPDLNPLEELFSYVKYYFKCHEDILQAVTDPKPIIKAAFQSVTKQDCLGWISHSGYM